MAFKIDVQKIDESFGPLQRVANDNIVDMIDQLAAALRPESGSNELVDEALALCKKVQDNYNEGFLDTLNRTITEYGKVIDIGEYLQKKASVGNVSNTSTSVQTGSIDPDAVVI